MNIDVEVEEERAPRKQVALELNNSCPGPRLEATLQSFFASSGTS